VLGTVVERAAVIAVAVAVASSFKVTMTNGCATTGSGGEEARVRKQGNQAGCACEVLAIDVTITPNQKGNPPSDIAAYQCKRRTYCSKPKAISLRVSLI
jgi:hypothetical protein